MTNLLLPHLRALRIDDLQGEFHYDGSLGGSHVRSLAMNERGMHYFAPIECSNFAGRTDEVVNLHVPSLQLEKLTALRYLKLANLRFSTARDIGAFGSCRQLHHLVFECCGWNMCNKTRDEKLSKALKQMSSLITFSSTGSSSYRTFLHREPQPRGFSFETKDFHRIHGHWGDISELPSLPSKIEEIDLSCAAAMASITNALKDTPARLSLSISLPFCPLVENDAVELLGNCPELQEVNLDGTSVTDVSPLLKCKKLYILSLRFTACSNPELYDAWKERDKGRPFYMAVIYWELPRGEKN